MLARVAEESGWSPRFAFMTMMSAGIAELGLLLSSPAVVIGAMLISPLMNPILGFGFSLALFDFRELRRSLKALAIGAVAAVTFTALLVLASPLQAPTAEIVARTRPNLFDLAVALFAALAGTFAIIRGRGDTIVGVAIATALMPPLAVVGYGIATRNAPVGMGAFALFVTNFITIALSATVMARFYGFGHYLSRRQGWLQTILLTLVFVVMAIPLGVSLNRIGREAVATSQARSLLSDRFGSAARVTQLDIDFTARPIVVRAVVITPRRSMQKTHAIQAALARTLGRPVRLNLDQILLGAGADALAAQREELRQAGEAPNTAAQRVTDLANSVALITGIAPDAVTIDRDHHRAVAAAALLPGATVATYRALEQRAAEQSEDWDVVIVPPQGPLPPIIFADGADTLDARARDAVAASAWAAHRWNVGSLAVPALPADGATPSRPTLAQRRALAVAALLLQAGIAAEPAPPAGRQFSLTPVAGNAP
ncbi:DUF389 domain-containing protein [Sphingomonas morindae]|uniref:DUF389 domain-containing protein n=1 Tax=Sphingomonas morindae TaxID=1541170 RepID=UPI003F5D5487